MLEKYYKKLKIANQTVLLITVILIINFFIIIDMNVLLIPNNAQKIPLNAPFLAFILIVVLFLSGLILGIIFIKERQKNNFYQEEKNVE